jgi:hypothetical protein
MKKIWLPSLLLLATLLFSSNLHAQSGEELQGQIEALNEQISNLEHTFDVLTKKIDDILWMQKLEDVAWVDKVYIYGPPLWQKENPTAQGAENPVKFWTYTIIPKNIDPSKKYPLMVLPHGGVHIWF